MISGLGLVSGLLSMEGCVLTKPSYKMAGSEEEVLLS